MKRVLFVFSFLFYFQAFSQSFCHFGSDSVRDVVWCGVDYSQLYLPPSFRYQMDKERIDSTAIQGYFVKMNVAIAEQFKRFDIGGTFLKGTYYDTSAVMNKLRNLNIHDNFVKKDTLSKDSISEILGNMTFQAKSGYGVICIPTRFELRKNNVTYYWVIFDMASKQVVLFEPTSVPVRGDLCYQQFFETFYSVRRKIKSSEYPRWLMEYCNALPVETRPILNK